MRSWRRLFGKAQFRIATSAPLVRVRDQARFTNDTDIPGTFHLLTLTFPTLKPNRPGKSGGSYLREDAAMVKATRHLAELRGRAVRLVQTLLGALRSRVRRGAPNNLVHAHRRVGHEEAIPVASAWT